MSQRATTGIHADEGGRDASGAGAPNRASGTGCRWSVTPVKAQNAIANPRRHATSHLDSEYTHDPAQRERIFRLLLAERDQIVALGPKYEQKARDEDELMALLERARDSHDAAVDRSESEPAGAPKIIPPRSWDILSRDPSAILAASAEGPCGARP